MNESDEYGTSIGVAKFISFLGWLAVIVGAGITIWLVKQGDMALLGIPSSITISLVGLLLVIGGQVSRAVMDNANYSKAMLEIMKKNYSPENPNASSQAINCPKCGHNMCAEKKDHQTKGTWVYYKCSNENCGFTEKRWEHK